MSEWYDNQKKPSNNFRKLLKERLAKANPRRTLAALDVPVVIWTGSKDHDHRNTREMVKKHGWRTIVIENAGHNKASQVAEQIASMLKEIMGTTGM